MELGTAHPALGHGMLIAVPAAGGLLLVSMGMMIGVGLALGGANVVVAYTVVEPLLPLTVTLNRLLYRGVVSPPPQLGGAHTASNPAPPADCPVTVVPETEATTMLLVTTEI